MRVAPNRTVVITGASSGIGAATAELLASNGASVVLVARGADRLKDVATRCGARAHAIPADMTRREDVRRVVRESVARLGHIDVWINNAGQGIWRLPSELTEDDVDAMVRANVKSALIGMQEALVHFAARGTGQIINVSSMLGRIPRSPERAAYTASKHFLNALTANFRDEVRAKHPGIVVSLVSPGVVYTDFGANAVHGGPVSRELPDGQEPAEIARVIAQTLETRAEDVYTRAGSHERVVRYYDSRGDDPVR